MTFYEKYLNQCKTKNISPSAAAVAAGFTRTSVTRWKKGSKPTDANVLLLAEYFGCSINDLKDDVETKKETPTRIGERDDEIPPELMKLARKSVLREMFEKLSEEDQYDVILQILARKQALKDLTDQK